MNGDKGVRDWWHAGFSIIELMVGIAVVALLMTVSVSMFLSTMTGASKDRAIQLVKQNGDFVTSRLETDLRGAKSVLSCTSAMDSVEYLDFDSNAYIWTIDNSNDKITLNGESVLSNYVTANSFVAECKKDSLSGNTLIKFSFELSYQRGTNSHPAESYTESFESTVALRNQ